MPERVSVLSNRKVLFHVVDVGGRPLVGARVEYVNNGKKVATIKVGRQPGTVEVQQDDDVEFVAYYGNQDAKRQKPDIQDRCIIKFSDVNLQPPPPPSPSPLPPPSMAAKIPTGVNLIIIFVFLLGLGFIA